MRRVFNTFFFVAYLSLSGCFPRKSAEELAAQQDAQKRLKEAMSQVRILFEPYAGCISMGPVEAISYGWELDHGDYSDAIGELRKLTLLRGANVAVMGKHIKPESLSKASPNEAHFHYHIFAETYKCNF